MDAQLTLRLPRDLARALARQARARGVPRSQLVREAVAKYVTEPERESHAEWWKRVEPFIGSVDLDYDALRADPIAQQMYDRNVRE
jgi:hypothetical protein